MYGFGAASDVKFVVAQKQFTTLMAELNKIGGQCGTVFFISGTGNFKTRTRKRSYSAVDMTIPYGEISPQKAFKTSINDVRNRVTTSYDPDFKDDQLKSVTSTLNDATSQGTGVNGYNEILELEDAAPFIADGVVAAGLNPYTLSIRKDQARVIPFTTNMPKHQRLEIGSVIRFKDWPAIYKVLGEDVLITDIFMVNSITKTGPDKVKIQVMQVDD